MPPRSPAVLAVLDHSVPLHPLGEESDHRMGRIGIELGAVRAVQPDRVAGVLDDRRLHAEADAEIRHLAFAGEACRPDLPLDAARAESTGCQHTVHPLERAATVALDLLRVDEFHPHRGAGGNPGVDQRLVEGLVRIGVMDVLANHPDEHFSFRIVEPRDPPRPIPRDRWGVRPPRVRAAPWPPRRRPARGRAAATGRWSRRPGPRTPPAARRS